MHRSSKKLASDAAVTPLPMCKTICKQQAELMKLVRDAQQKGFIRITQEHEIHSGQDIQSTAEIRRLLAMVRDAQRAGHVHLMRRESTEEVPMAAGLYMRVGKHSK